MANKLLCLLLFGGIYVGLWCGEVTCNKTDSEDVIFDNSTLSEIEEVDSAENGSLFVVDYKKEIWPNSSENGEYKNLSEPIPPETIHDLALHWRALNLSATCLETARRLNLLAKTKSDCGGILVNSKGVIRTDGPLNDCKWLVCNDYGMYVRIKLWNRVKNCDRAYIKICDGCQFSQNGSELEKGTRHEFCGLPFRSEFLSPNQLIVIQVLSNWFLADYQLLKRKPDCILTSHDENGTITSPEYPDSHPHYMSCKWNINAPVEYRIVLTVMDFRMDCPRDGGFLQIWDGTYEEYPMITSYDNHTLPPPTFTSNSNSITISSYIYHYCDFSRFKLTWKFIRSGCNETLRVSSGVISSPGFSNFDRSRLFCNWRIIVNPGSIIRLVFLDFWATFHNFLSCDEDYVEIADIDGNHTSKTRYCYDRDPPGAIYTTGNEVGIKLVMSPLLHMDRTFRLRFGAVCTTTVVGYKGTIESINFPNLPPPHLNCMWAINAPNHGSVFINLTRFEYDGGFLKIFEPDEDVSPAEIGCFIESSEGGKPSCLSRGNKVIVEYKTSSSKLFITKGFQIEWTIRGCVESISSTFGNFQSPGYPHLYPVSEVCEWTIVADSGSGLELTIHDWEIENSTDCKFDGLKVYTRSLHVSQLLLDLCGTNQYPSIVTTQLSELIIRFYSDESLSFKGFNASFKQITTLDSTRNCGEDHFGSTGFMYSPNFPNFYNNFDNCRWTITVHPNYLAALKILEMELDHSWTCQFDNLTVYYSNSVVRPSNQVVCGKQNLTKTVSTSNVMTVTFQSDSEGEYKGFKSMFFQACGANLNRDRGIIHSPDFLTMMNGAGNCSWTIVASALESRVLLLFTEFHWSVTDPYCGQHFLEVLDGNNLSLYRGCCSHLPPVTLGLDNTLTLRTTNAEDLIFKAFFFTLTKDCVRILRANRVSNMTTSIQNANAIESELECQQTLHSTDGDKQTVRVQIQLYQPEVHRNVCRTNFVAVHGKGFSEPPTKYSCLQGIPNIENVLSHYWTVYIILDESNGYGDGLSTGKDGNLNRTNLLLENNFALSGTAAQSGKLISLCPLLLYVAMG